MNALLRLAVGASLYSILLAPSLAQQALPTNAIPYSRGPGVTTWSGITPAPNQVIITNGTNVPTSSTFLPATNFPALTGNVTTSAGSLATTIGALQVTNGMLAGSIAASKLIGADIATVGTITAGTWHGTPIASTYLVGTDIATVGTLTSGATGAGFTVNIGASNLTGLVPNANISGSYTGINGLGTVTSGALNGVSITGLGTCTNATDACPKSYIDATATSIIVHPSVIVATTAALATVTYANGASGVGSTLTATAMGKLTVDGHDVLNGERVLVKNQTAVACGGGSANGCQNGVYTQTTLGDAGTAFVLTRATDSNAPGVGPALLGTGNYYLVTAGTANVASSWIITTANPITIGTTAVTFAQFAASPAYSTDSTLTLTGSTFGINVPVLVATGGTGATTLTGLLQGNGTGAFTGISNSSTTGQILRVTGASTYAWGALNLANSSAITGNLLTANLPTLTSALLWIGNGSNAATAVALSGDITVNNAGVTAIGATKVTNSMLAGSIAASKLIGTDIATVGTITTGVWNAGAVTSSGAVTGTQFIPTGGTPSNNFYLAGANNPAIASNSKRRVSVDSSGNVNIVGDGSAGGNIQFGGFVAEYQLSSYCTLTANSFNNVTDMTTCINAAIAQAFSDIAQSGGYPRGGPGARVRIPCGAIKISTIRLLPYVEVAGGGRGCTVFFATSNGMDVAASTQYLFGSVHDLTIISNGTNTGTGLLLHSAQGGVFYNMEIYGYSGSGGVGLAVLPTVNSPTQYWVADPFGLNGNAIFNYFDNIFISNSETGVSISGQFGGGVGEHCNEGANPTDATDNYFSRMTIWDAANGVLITGCADSNHWSKMEIFPKTNGSCFFIGAAGGTGGQLDVYQQEIDLLCGGQRGTGLTMIAHNGNSWGHHVKITTDELAAVGVGSFSACIGPGGTTIDFASLNYPSLCVPTVGVNATSGGYSDAIQFYVNTFAGYLGATKFGTANNGQLCFDNATFSPVAVIQGCPSDVRLKENFATLKTSALDSVLALNPTSFNWINDANKALRTHFVAQEVYGQMPECRTTLPDKMPDGGDKYGVDDGCILAYGVKAIQVTYKEVETLRQRLTEAYNMVYSLQRRMDQLEVRRAAN